jgi:hypothetical protein
MRANAKHPTMLDGAMIERLQCSDRAKDNKCPCAIHIRVLVNRKKARKNNKKNVASTKNIASTSEEVSEVESEAEDDETL